MTRIHTIRARQADAGFVGDGAIVCEPMLPNSLEDDSTFLWKSRGIPAGFGADPYDLTWQDGDRAVEKTDTAFVVDDEGCVRGGGFARNRAELMKTGPSPRRVFGENGGFRRRGATRKARRLRQAAMGTGL